MRKITLLVIVFIFFGAFIKDVAAQKDIFIKEFQFELKKISENQYENEYFVTITLNRNSMYKFTVLNHIGDFPGIAIVELLENDKVIATNYMNGKYYEQFLFKCNKTGFYDILIHFQDNKTGASLIKLFLVK